jgi:hypothetical protein
VAPSVGGAAWPFGSGGSPPSAAGLGAAAGSGVGGADGDGVTPAWRLAACSAVLARSPALAVGELGRVRLDRLLAGHVGAKLVVVELLVVGLVFVELVEIIVGQVVELLVGDVRELLVWGLVDRVQPLLVATDRLVRLRAQPSRPRRGRRAGWGVVGVLGARAVGGLVAGLVVHAGQPFSSAVADSEAKAPGSWSTKSTIDRR